MENITAEIAIQTSRRENRTVRIPRTPEAESTLLVECDDSVVEYEGCDEMRRAEQYWGADWSVTLIG